VRLAGVVINIEAATGEEGAVKAPNSNIQAPEKLQISIIKLQR